MSSTPVRRPQAADTLWTRWWSHPDNLHLKWAKHTQKYVRNKIFLKIYSWAENRWSKNGTCLHPLAKRRITQIQWTLKCVYRFFSHILTSQKKIYNCNFKFNLKIETKQNPSWTEKCTLTTDTVYLYSEIEHQTVWMSLCQLIEKVSPCGVCNHLLQPSRSLKMQNEDIWKLRGHIFFPHFFHIMYLNSCRGFQKSHLSFNSKDGISFLGVKVFYQETLEMVFYSLLDLSRLHTLSQGQENDILLR